MDIYRENILDHFRQPRNFGKVSGAQVSFEQYNPLCGDRVRIFLRLKNKRVVAAGFVGEGCAISLAAASMLTEEVKGRKLRALSSLDRDDILSLLGIAPSPSRLKCALLPLEALRGAVAELRKEKR